jgi:hypothetical protein
MVLSSSDWNDFSSHSFGSGTPAGFAMSRAPASIGRDLAAPIDDFLIMTSAKIKAWVAEVKEDASPMSWF